ncbi:hypothetical protein [Nitrosococcus oceani]|uniref:hypothetical protein n=1 Tax=Nitrosococcus oceani TaxID=1229 RepID=UPI0012DF098A|nr:hypothetical protein [Nitrosococcus oceani]
MSQSWLVRPERGTDPSPFHARPAAASLSYARTLGWGNALVLLGVLGGVGFESFARDEHVFQTRTMPAVLSA